LLSLVAARVPDPSAELAGISVLRLPAAGFTNKEIAAQFDVRVKTIETHKTRAMEQLGLRSRVDLVRVAIERGWLHALSRTRWRMFASSRSSRDGEGNAARM
jgi:DNA-binding CsgD family transcriptional regulator